LRRGDLGDSEKFLPVYPGIQRGPGVKMEKMKDDKQYGLPGPDPIRPYFS
jgi:hypothetical protein